MHIAKQQSQKLQRFKAPPEEARCCILGQQYWFIDSTCPSYPSPDISPPLHVPEGLTKIRLWMDMTKVKDEE